MLCYKDKTFCPFYGDCKHGHDCERAETPEVIVRADKIGLPICSFADKPSCWEAKN